MHIALLWSAPFGHWRALWIIPQLKPHRFCRVCIFPPEAFCFYHPTAAIAAPAHRSHLLRSYTLPSAGVPRLARIASYTPQKRTVQFYPVPGEN